MNHGRCGWWKKIKKKFAQLKKFSDIKDILKKIVMTNEEKTKEI